MRLQYETTIQDEREHWEYQHDQELQEEQHNNERLVGEMQSFTGKLQSVQQELQREHDAVVSYQRTVQTTNA